MVYDGKEKQGNKIRWLRLAIALFGFIILSFGLAYLLQNIVAKFHSALYSFAWLAYLIVFGTQLGANLTILLPVPVAVSVMIAAATKWNPALIALSGSIGGTLGELSGYYAGYLGKKMAIAENTPGYSRIEGWIQRYGMWAIAFLAFQPIIPFDIGGLVAGVAKMPLHKFLLALLVGKFPKYLILTLAGIGLIHSIPFLS